MPIQMQTGTGVLTDTVFTARVGNTLTIYAHEGWTDEDFDAVIQAHGLMDSLISEWEYGILNSLDGDAMEMWVIRL